MSHSRHPASRRADPHSRSIGARAERPNVALTARRAGNEFLFQMMAQQTAETLNAVFEGREPK
ncbi:hypothetical protein, partial [Amycolatopsis sp. NPDC051371]|uniref:hypothetical protein n=1 Tax=Amycolatopsis sp. NPDC051371 TaxID=3155800 RepID=UPI00344182D7